MAKTDHRASLDRLGIEAVCDMLREGASYRSIAKKLSMPLTALWRWVNGDEDRSTAARAALQESADAWDLEAEKILKGLKAGATNAEVQKARELAQHYRWRAAKRNPRVYGEKQSLDVSGTMDVALTEEQVDARLLKLFAKAGKSSAD